MKVLTLENHAELSFFTARLLVEQLQAKPDSVLCLASGDSPRLAYDLFTVLLKHSGIDYSRFTLIGLDEWIGIPPDNPGSCHYFLRKHLLAPLALPSGQYRLFDAGAADLETECAAMNAFIAEKGGIDLMLVGIGMNGHIGFNEPGVDPDLRAHVISLDETTQQVGQKYFSGKTELKQGITLGMKQLQEARSAILIASGKRKAPIVHDALEGPVSTDVPASLLRLHANSTVVLDREAAALLRKLP